MSLPKYRPVKRDMPVLDARTAANPWGTPTEPAASFDAESVGRHEPTNAERARTVIGNNRLGVLAVVAPEVNGPMGFVVPYAVTSAGMPFFGVRSGVQNTVQLRPQAQVSLTVAETPLTASHSGVSGGVTVLGVLHVIDNPVELEAAVSEYGRTQPADATAVKRGAACLYRIVPNRVLVTTTAGDLESLDLEEYASSSSDPLAAIAPGLVSHLSNDQGGSLVLLCRAYGGQPSATSAQLAGIDQYGMDLLAITPQGRESVRLNFAHPVSSSEEVRRELTSMARGARFKLGVG